MTTCYTLRDLLIVGWLAFVAGLTLAFYFCLTAEPDPDDRAADRQYPPFNDDQL